MIYYNSILRNFNKLIIVVIIDGNDNLTIYSISSFEIPLKMTEKDLAWNSNFESFRLIRSLNVWLWMNKCPALHIRKSFILKKIEKEDENQCWLFNSQLLSCDRICYCLLMSKPFFLILCNLFYSLSFFNLLKIMRQKSYSIVNSNSSYILNKWNVFHVIDSDCRYLLMPCKTNAL